MNRAQTRILKEIFLVSLTVSIISTILSSILNYTFLHASINELQQSIVSMVLVGFSVVFVSLFLFYSCLSFRWTSASGLSEKDLDELDSWYKAKSYYKWYY